MSQQKVSSSVFELFLGKALRAPLWLFISAVVARLLGPEGVGAWSMTLAAGMLLNQFLFHWTQSITQRFGRSSFVELGHLNDVFALRMVLLLGGLLLGASLIILLNEWFEKLFGIQPELKVFLALAAFWLMAETQSLQQVQSRFVQLAWSPIVADLILLAALAAVALDAPPVSSLTLNEQLTFFLWAMSAGWLVFFLLELRAVKFRPCLPKVKNLIPVLAFSAPLIPGYLIAYFSEWSDYFLIKHFINEYSVGLYHPAFQFLLIFIGLPTALAAVLIPKFVELFDKNPSESLQLLLDSYAPWLNLGWGMAVLLPIAILPTVFSLLVGAEFDESVSLLTVLLIATPGAVTQHVFGISYFLRGKLLFSTFAFFLLKLILNILITVLLINSMGLLAAAIGAAVSYLTLQWLFVVFAFPGRRPCKGTVITLLWCQLCGLILTFTSILELRIITALGLMSVTFIYIRTYSFFDRSLLLSILPKRFERHVDTIARWLIKSKYQDK